MAEKGVEEQVLAMERLLLFSAILLLFTLKGVRGIHSNEKNN